MLLIIVYLCIAMTVINGKSPEKVCRDMGLIIRDTVYAGFITMEEITSILKENDLYPVDKQLEEVHTGLMEEVLSGHPLINHVECYKTPSGKVNVAVSQRIPLLRVMERDGKSYYLDDQGKIMPAYTHVIAHIPVVTGFVREEFVRNELYGLAMFLQQDKFWNAQVMQVNVLANGEIELVPRVGEHLIFLGKPDKIAEKLSRLRTFYDKALGKVGWNKYSRISLEFENQIICTKR